jgi:hypothetical protein
MCIAGFLYPRNQPAPKATIATAMVRVLSKGFDLRSFAENAVPSLIVPNPPNRARLREQDEANLRYFGRRCVTIKYCFVTFRRNGVKRRRRNEKSSVGVGAKSVREVAYVARPNAQSTDGISETSDLAAQLFSLTI